MSRLRLLLASPLMLALVCAAPKKGMDPVNPTCPSKLNWSDNEQMLFSVRATPAGKVLIGEGAIDDDMATRLSAVLRKNPDIEEFWIRSPGGNAEVGNQAGRMIRKYQRDITTRIPAGWACFSACNFVFMGGRTRIVEPGGQFAVHMFTHVGDRAAVRSEIEANAEGAVDMIGDIEQSSAMLASDDNDFLIKMGVSRKLLTDVMYKQKAVAGRGQDKSTRRCLTQAELPRYGVTNAVDASD